jgi:NitT/TauT family transport system substrate-binding protein
MVVNQIGSAVDIGARAMLRQDKLEATRDYTVVEAPFPTMAAMLLQNKADLIATTPPFSYDARLEGKTKLLFDLKQAMGETEMIVEASRAPFLKRSRAAMVDYLEDVVRFTHWILDPANRKAAVALAADVAKQPVAQMESYYLTDKDVYHAPDTIPDLAVLQRNIDTQHGLGFIKNSIDVKQYSDLSLVQEAAKRYATNP